MCVHPCADTRGFFYLLAVRFDLRKAAAVGAPLLPGFLMRSFDPCFIRSLLRWILAYSPSFIYTPIVYARPSPVLPSSYEIEHKMIYVLLLFFVVLLGYCLWLCYIYVCLLRLVLPLWIQRVFRHVRLKGSYHSYLRVPNRSMIKAWPRGNSPKRDGTDT